jgi:NAD(P) transhydrogenase subunit alpha
VSAFLYLVAGVLFILALRAVGDGTGSARVFGFLALMLASVNIFGGFLATQRMPSMYRRKER